jgi:type IV pilus assembly protein PilY1
MTRRTKTSVRRNARQRVLSAIVAFAAVLVSAPGHAIDIPAVPLQSGSAYPPANIRFILDDSGSMNFVAMPKDVQSFDDNTNYGGGVQDGLNDNPTDRSSLNNTIYYNPEITYKAWIKADKTRYPDITDVSCVTTSLRARTGGCRDLRDSSESYFYVPKTGVTASTDADDFTKYWIRNNSGTAQVVIASNSTLGTWTQSINTKTWWYQSVVVPAGVTSLVVSIGGGSGGDADLYVKKDSKPTGGSGESSSTSNGNTESVTVNNPAAATWWIGVYNYSGSKQVKNEKLTVTTSGVQAATPPTKDYPTGRTQAAELQNIGNWYTYARTRTKVAKSGAGEAFSSMGSGVRVGFDTIWNENEFPIPVGGNDNGVFIGTNSGDNRATWYDRLYAAGASGSTPLLGALRRAGESFKDTSAKGPWGPETDTNQLSCRQNFAILTTDGYWNSTSGYGDDEEVGDADGTAGPTITDPKGASWTYDVANPYKDNLVTTTCDRRGHCTTTSGGTVADTLADVAMAYWKNDLRPETDMPNNVPSSNADPAFWQHMVTFGVSIGLKGTLNPSKGTLDAITEGTQHWPNPITNSGAERIDDLWHATVNGRGSFVVASNPDEFTKGLLDALETVAARLGSASNVTSNSTSFASDTRVYQASYVSGKWTGELSAYAATDAGVADDPSWTAAAKVTATGRNVYTWNGTAGASFPTTAQVAALDQTSRKLSPVSGADNAAYIKGDQSKEGTEAGQLRVRDTLLGDIVDSSPMYVKDSDTLFVGANDGMLHAFDAQTGDEYFAYVPAGISMSDLATLSDPEYSHKFFVDGAVVVSTKAQTEDHNYLVAALGRGGKGVFGLDVTDPDSFKPSTDVLWESSAELSTAQQDDMGYVLGEPLIATLNDDDKTQVAIVSNGINSNTGTAALFVIELATGKVLQELDTGITGDNGLMAPRGWDDNGDGTVDYVYAGDLKGNLWKFDFTKDTASIAMSGQPMFTTASGQPITAGLALARDPATGTRWVFAGSGKFLENGDVKDDTVQSLYGIIDDAPTATLTRSNLQERVIEQTDTMGGGSVRSFEPHGPLDDNVQGWYIDLDKPSVVGERIISRPQVKGSVLIVASIIPPTDDSCEAGGGGYINALDAFTGSSTTEPFFDANGDGKVDENDQLKDADGNPVPVGSIGSTVGMPTLPISIGNRLFYGGSKSGIGDPLTNPQGGTAKRISWREILED